MAAASLDAARPEPSIHQAGLLAAAEAEGQTVMVYCRTAILERAMPEPETAGRGQLSGLAATPSAILQPG